VGGECVRRRGSVVTSWGRKEEGGEDRRREWMRRGRKSSWEGEQWLASFYNFHFRDISLSSLNLFLDTLYFCSNYK
jgi:hypothetical protein